MLISEFFDLKNQYHQNTPGFGIYNSRVESAGGCTVMLGLWREGQTSYFAYASGGDRGAESFSRWGFRKEALAVYHMMDHFSCDLNLKRGGFPDYKVLKTESEEGKTVGYGVVIKLRGVWMVYLCDTTVMQLGDQTCATAEDAAAFADLCVKTSPDVMRLVADFVRDYQVKYFGD